MMGLLGQEKVLWYL